MPSKNCIGNKCLGFYMDEINTVCLLVYIHAPAGLETDKNIMFLHTLTFDIQTMCVSCIASDQPNTNTQDVEFLLSNRLNRWF